MDRPSPGLSLRDLGRSLRTSCLPSHSSSTHSPLMQSPPGQGREISAKAEVDETEGGVQIRGRDKGRARGGDDGRGGAGRGERAPGLFSLP